MTDAQAALARLHGAVRLLSSPQYDEAMTMVAVGDLKGILAHVEAQKAEIERLRAVAQHEADCAEAYRAQIETMIAAAARLTAEES